MEKIGEYGLSPKYPSYCCLITKSYLTLCNSMNCSMPGLPVLHCLLNFAQTHVHRVNDALLPSHSLSPPSPPALSLFFYQHQGLFQLVISLHQVAKILELQLQHESFQWILMWPFKVSITMRRKKKWQDQEVGYQLQNMSSGYQLNWSHPVMNDYPSDTRPVSMPWHYM